MHHLRHKNILKTMRKLAEIDEDIAQFLSGKITLHFATATDSTLALVTSHDNNLETDEASPSRKQLESKAGKKSGSQESSVRRLDVEAFAKTDTDFISEAIHLEVDEGKGGWNSKYTIGALSSTGESGELGTDSEVEAGENPEDPGTPSTAKQMRRDKKMMGFMKACHIHGSTNKLFHKKTVQSDPYGGLDPEIFERLGIKVVNPIKNSPVRKDLMRKLIAQLKEDISIQTQERAEAQTRADGFWNWAGKSAYHIIMENRKNIDWATGVRTSIPNEKSGNQEQTQQAPKDEIEDNEVKATGETEVAEYAPDDMSVDAVSDDIPLQVNNSPEAQATPTVGEGDIKTKPEPKPKPNDTGPGEGKRPKRIGVLRIV
jgi:hypothetical protein